MEKRKFWNEIQFQNWLYSLGGRSSVAHDAKNDPPSVYPCYVLWKEWTVPHANWDGGCYGYVYFNDF